MPYPTEDLSGRVIAITGASAGIGRETALLLAEAGVKVVLGARRVERLEELVEQIGADNALAVPLDVRDAESNRAFVAAAIERFGRLDGLVANAGIGVYGGMVDPVPMLTLFDKQVTLRMGQANVKRWVDDIMPLLTDDDPLGVDGFATHVLPLEEAPHAYEIFQKKTDGAVKVILRP